MKIFNEKYIKRQFINKNEYLEIYRAINSITNDTVKLKVFNNESKISQLKEEVNILKDMENKNLIGINTMGSFIENDKTYYYIETEDFLSQSLSEKIKDYKFSTVEAVKILRQVCEGLREFHFKALVYGNLSCENIYIDSNGLVKVDTLDCLNIKDTDENLSEEDDIFSLGVILFQLVTGKMEFKPGKCKSEVSDNDLLFIIDRCTNKKYAAYEDLNKLIEDLSSYIEYGGISSRFYKSANEELYDEVELDEISYKFKPIKLIRNIGACVLLFLMIATVINGKSILNLNKNKENTETTNNSTVVTDPNKEIVEELVEEEKDQEQVLTDVYDESYNNQLVYNNIEEENSNNNYGYTNNNRPVIRPNYNINNNTSNNSNSNNNIQNSDNNNPGNNTNIKPDDEDVNNGGNIEEETPQIPTTPDVTPDSGNTEGDNSEGESEV